MKTWEDILSARKQEGSFDTHIDGFAKGYNNALADILTYLHIAEAKGECCLNPPTKDELYKIVKEVLTEFDIKIDEVLSSKRLDIILTLRLAKRIKEGK